MPFQYLEPKQNYEDRYDIQTIKQCLGQLKTIDEVGKKLRLQKQLENFPESEHERHMGIFRSRALFVTMGLRYKDRASTIADWIKEDKERQDKLDNTLPPEIDCPECGSKMIAEDFRNLEDWSEDQPMRVLFFFDCSNCDHRLGAYDDGEIFFSKPEICPQCNEELVVKRVRKDKIITTTSTCSNCDYSKKETENLEEKEIEHERWEKQQK